MITHSPFRYLQPVFFGGLFDDPVFLVRIRPLRRALLFDCGQMQHLAKRVLKSISTVFISHAHMDHFMGFDTLIRNVHVSTQNIDIFGPPGIGDKVCRKLAAYDWNLTEPSWCSFRVHDIHPQHLHTRVLAGPEGYPCQDRGEWPRTGPAVHQQPYVRVEAAQCDHMIPSLIFRLTEQPVFAIDEEKLSRLGLVRGEWLRVLKKRLFLEELETPLTVLRKSADVAREEQIDDISAFYATIRNDHHPSSIGYMTDIGYTDDNVDRVVSLLKGVTLLVCECAFLAENRDRARASHHFCTSDLNDMVDRLRPAYVLPIHLSKTYAGRSHLLYEQLEFPPGVTLLRLPDHVSPRPLLSEEAVELFPAPRKRKAVDSTLLNW